MTNSERRAECGCSVILDPELQVWRRSGRCSHHKSQQRLPELLDSRYYLELGAIVDSTPKCRHHVDELLAAFNELDYRPKFRADLAVELGCGVSMYAPWLLRFCQNYLGIDASPWACRWTSEAYVVDTVCGGLEDVPFPNYDLLLSAHSLEHVANLWQVVSKMRAAARQPATVWLVVPDDTDLANPDHEWFFSENSLRRLLLKAGFSTVQTVSRQVVQHEKFIYAVAET